MSLVGKHLEIWDVQSQELDVRKVKYPASGDGATYPLFWTNDNKNILGAFRFTNDNPSTIFCEFDASTLEIVGVPFEGHSDLVTGLALSFDGSLLASAAWDNTVKLWAFESRQLLASFHVQNPYIIALSPDSHQLAYTTITNDEICICDIPLEVFAQTSVHLKGSTADFQRISSSRPPQLPPDPREPLASSSHTHTVSSARSVESDALPPEATLKDLTKHIIKDGNYPVARGGFGEIWKSTLHIDDSSVKVAVKALQVYAEDELKAAKRKKIKRIKRELRICANLKHANILPVFGYTHGFGPFPAIVSPWAENGNLTVYLEREGEALTLVQRFQLLRDIIAGLQYLHANNVIHGDFNGPNVLIHGDGTACVADFGLSLMYSEVISASQASWTSTLKGNMRWMAPELLVEREDGSQARPTKQSDMYSFGGIMLQVRPG
ncbi:kinase-like domain-containing protein [Suillus variegatus]|nr:kinase-like domain-containing protein [Suillus variegatus]